jgi:DNA-binding CsgD family transcriptional regulator
MPVAVIMDIVGSRLLLQRDVAQHELDAVLRDIHATHPLAVEPLRPIVGDEEQGVFPDLGSALATTLLLQLGRPKGVDCRFGIGVGAIRSIESAGRTIAEGPGWWAAREAIDSVHQRQQRPPYTARTWSVASPEENAAMQSSVRTANSALLVRDQLVASLSDRQRRLAYGRCMGMTQRELAEREAVRQSAVSQALNSSGASALVASFEVLASGTTA